MEDTLSKLVVVQLLMSHEKVMNTITVGYEYHYCSLKACALLAVWEVTFMYHDIPSCQGIECHNMLVSFLATQTMGVYRVLERA